MKSFEDAAASLAAAGRKLPNSDGDEVVFIGKAIAVKYSVVGTSYADGHRHVAVQTAVVPRRSNRALSAALQSARESKASLFAAIETVPRSDRQAADILVRATDLDRVVAELLPAARAAIAGAKAAPCAMAEKHVRERLRWPELPPEERHSHVIIVQLKTRAGKTLSLCPCSPARLLRPPAKYHC
jgi:hypothetical protein